MPDTLLIPQSPCDGGSCTLRSGRVQIRTSWRALEQLCITSQSTGVDTNPWHSVLLTWSSFKPRSGLRSHRTHVRLFAKRFRRKSGTTTLFRTTPASRWYERREALSRCGDHHNSGHVAAATTHRYQWPTTIKVWSDVAPAVSDVDERSCLTLRKPEDDDGGPLS